LETAWTEQLNRTDGPFLFGEFSAVDAYFSPVVMRLQTYNLPINDRCRVYMDQVCQHRAVQDWIETAKETAVFIDFEEPYRLGGDGADQKGGPFKGMRPHGPQPAARIFLDKK
jgi:glutathione S-transferase